MAGIVRWRVHLAALAGAIMFTGLLAWGRLDPIAVVESAASPSVKPGGFVQVEREVQWNRHDCWSYVASTSLVDSLKFNHEVEARDFGLPDYGRLTSREWQVPFTMPWGETKLRTDLSFSCFPFFKAWPVVLRLPEVTFTVARP